MVLSRWTISMVLLGHGPHELKEEQHAQRHRHIAGLTKCTNTNMQ